MEKNVVIDVVKICAVGCSQSFATFKIGSNSYTCFISRNFYNELKSLGVPTAQKIRWIKEKNKNEDK